MSGEVDGLDKKEDLEQETEVDSWNTSKTNVSVVINIKAHTWHRHRHAKFIKIASQMIKEFMQVKMRSVHAR